MMTLADLLTAAKHEHGGWRVLVERSGLSPAVWNKLERGLNTSFPEPETVTGLAKGLRISEREVIIAAAEGLGFEMADNGSQLGRLIPPAVDRLPERAKRVLLDLAESLVGALLGEPNGAASNAATPSATARDARRRADTAKKRLAVGD